MNTVAHTYRTALELFNRDASSHDVEVATAECVSAFAATGQAVIFIDLCKSEDITDSHQNFWTFLETYGLTVKFWERWNHDGSYMGLLQKNKSVPDDIAQSRVLDVSMLALAA